MLPEHQGKGIGTALVKEGHAIAARLGWGHAVILGSAAFYARAGYRPAALFGIIPPFDVPDENFMALRLRDDTPGVREIMRYAEEFGI